MVGDSAFITHDRVYLYVLMFPQLDINIYIYIYIYIIACWRSFMNGTCRSFSRAQTASLLRVYFNTMSLYGASLLRVYFNTMSLYGFSVHLSKRNNSSLDD